MKNKLSLAKSSEFKKYGSFMILLIEIIFFSLLTDNFFSVSNFLSVGRQLAPTGIAAIGVAVCIILGGIDISVGMMLAFSSVIISKLMVEMQLPIGASILITLLGGVVFGVFVGFSITFLKMPPMIATLAAQTIAKAIAYLITGGIPIYNLPDSFKFIGQGYLGIVPVSLILMLLVYVLAYWVLEKTPLGRHIYATGSNKEAARLSGINTRLVVFLGHIASCTLAALAGIVMCSRVNSGQPSIGVGFEMDCITAAVIGGVSLSGGEGKITTVIAGVLTMGFLTNGMVLLGLSEYWQWFAKGCVLVFAVSFDNFQKGVLKQT